MDISLEEMMQAMEEGKKSAFHLSIIIHTILLLAAIFIIFLIDCFILKFIFKTSGFKLFHISSILVLLVYSFLLGAKWHHYKYGNRTKNQSPWHFGIYQAYYECSKCNSLTGGIFGKGPTARSILDTECIHDWQAVYKNDFIKKMKAQKDMEQIPFWQEN
ncbi:MAG: hypothetical protein FWG75_04820 [Cystobacterineae bacterium]|nr:hypothetical protein [Cystobacterineae bacterium]